MIIYYISIQIGNPFIDNVCISRGSEKITKNYKFHLDKIVSCFLTLQRIFLLLTSPEEGEITKQSCRDEVVVFGDFCAWLHSGIHCQSDGTEDEMRESQTPWPNATARSSAWNFISFILPLVQEIRWQIITLYMYFFYLPYTNVHINDR